MNEGDIEKWFEWMLNEPKRDFGYFPEEWENAIALKIPFINFAKYYLHENEFEKILYSKEVDTSSYSGFLKEENNGKVKYSNIFRYLENGECRYLQADIRPGTIKTIFFEGDFSISRIYMGIPQPFLGSVKRFGNFGINKDLSIQVVQHSLEVFDVEFLEREIPTINFSLSGYRNGDKKYVSIIKEFPLIFYDLEGIREKFGDILIKNNGTSFHLEEFLEVYRK